MYTIYIQLYTFYIQVFFLIEKLFSSKTRTRLLLLFLFNQNKEFHLRELAGLIKVTPIYVSKELNNLKQLGIVNASKKGNLSIFSVNTNCVFLNELKLIFMKTDFIGNLLKEKLEEKAEYAFIFGSFAKGTESENSDIDLFLISEIKEEKLIELIQNIEEKTKREINYILWNKKTFTERKKNNHLLKTIKKEPIIMIIGEENEFRKQIK
jgi:predicted nucleotidyltransferase